MAYSSWSLCHGGVKKLIGFITGAAIGFAVYFVLGMSVGYNNAETRAIEQAVQNSNAGLPIMIDDSTRLDRVAIDQKNKRYTYFISIIDLTASEIDISIMNQHFFLKIPNHSLAKTNN